MLSLIEAPGVLTDLGGVCLTRKQTFGKRLQYLSLEPPRGMGRLSKQPAMGKQVHAPLIYVYKRFPRTHSSVTGDGGCQARGTKVLDKSWIKTTTPHYAGLQFAGSINMKKPAHNVSSLVNLSVEKTLKSVGRSQRQSNRTADND